MRKKKWMAIVLTGMMTLAAPVAAWAEETEAQSGEAAADTETAAEAEGPVLSDDIYDFQIEMEGSLYQLPMTYEELIGYGWELSSREDPSLMLGSNEYTMMYFTKGEYKICADMLNLGINENPVTDCLVGGISVDVEYEEYDLEALNIRLAKGITVGTSTIEDIKAAYGEPSDSYEGEMGTSLTYQMDYSRSAELYVSKEAGCLVEVDIRNFSEPEGFDKGSVSTEMPEIVSSYETPAALGETMMEPVVEFCGDLYQLPCPVTALEANGWKILDLTDEDYVAGDDIAFLDLMRDNQTIYLTAYNLTPNAVLPNNCFVTEMQAATYDESVTMTISGNITLGANREELIATAKELGFTYEDEEDYLTIFGDPQDEYSRYIEFWFNDEESETEAASVTYRNELFLQ